MQFHHISSHKATNQLTYITAPLSSHPGVIFFLVKSCQISSYLVIFDHWPNILPIILLLTCCSIGDFPHVLTALKTLPCRKGGNEGDLVWKSTIWRIGLPYSVFMWILCCLSSELMLGASAIISAPINTPMHWFITEAWQKWGTFSQYVGRLKSHDNVGLSPSKGNIWSP